MHTLIAGGIASQLFRPHTYFYAEGKTVTFYQCDFQMATQASERTHVPKLNSIHFRKCLVEMP